MRHRIILASAVLAPSGVAFALAGLAPELVQGREWWPAAVAVVLAVVLWASLRRSLVLVVVAAGLGALGASSIARARVQWTAVRDLQTPSALPSWDLTTSEPLQAPLPPFIRVKGYFRPAWTLDEYAVPPGQLPDQSSTPGAVLVPFAGSTSDRVEVRVPSPSSSSAPGPAVVVVRVGPQTLLDDTQPTVVRGRATPLQPELRQTLVDVQGPGAGSVAGVLVDTLAVPEPRDAGLDLALACVLLTLAALTAYYASAPRTPAP